MRGQWRNSRSVLVFVAVAASTTAQEHAPLIAEMTLPVEIMRPARPSVEKGLRFLAERQLEDGAFATGGYGRNAAVVALAGMAWLAEGSTPGRGKYGDEVARAADYLLE